jgi:DMSO reductase anchor subunit
MQCLHQQQRLQQQQQQQQHLLAMQQQQMQGLQAVAVQAGVATLSQAQALTQQAACPALSCSLLVLVALTSRTPSATAWSVCFAAA